MTEFRIGTRGSKLALWQANKVAELVRQNFPALDVSIQVIKTTGDKIRDVALSKIGDKGLFTKDLEYALMKGEIDCCVHSMKDVPTDLPEGMVLAAMLERADVRDALVAREKTTLMDLPAGARVGTGSLRRRAQLMALRPDLDYVELRGNLDTRLGKVADGTLDAAVLASAGIDRMGWSERIVERLSPTTIVPAVGQGAIGVEILEDSTLAQEVCDSLAHRETMDCVACERALMRGLEGGCQVPIGAYARIADGQMVADALVATLDGSQVLRSHCQDAPDAGGFIAQHLMDDLISQGAAQILDDVRNQAAEPASGTVIS